MQLAHEQEKSNLFTSKTDDWWRLIRKGLSPAFSANNLRCAGASLSLLPPFSALHKVLIHRTPAFVNSYSALPAALPAYQQPLVSTQESSCLLKPAATLVVTLNRERREK
jgi:hypothetical protein